MIALTRSRSYRSSRRLFSWRHGLQVGAAAVVVTAAADDDRWKTDPAAAAAAVVDRAAASSAPSTIATAVGSCARFAAGPSVPAPKGSTRLSSNWIFRVADCSADWRRAGPEWSSGRADHRGAWGPALIAALVAATLLLKVVEYRWPR